MYANQGGVLAVCQVGILKRAVVIDIGECLIKLINPVIALQPDTQLTREGCNLSKNILKSVVKHGAD